MANIPSRDHYFRRAKEEKYPARAVYKLQQLDKRFKLLRKGQRIIDLGAAPGSWSQYAAQRIGPKGSVLAIDLKPPKRPINGVEWRQGDVTELDPDRLMADGGPFDLVLSDMAPNTTGHRAVDAARSHHLAQAAFLLAGRILKPKGAAVVKVFVGEDFHDLIREVKGLFKRTKTMKPDASLKQSRETYLVAWEPKADNIPGPANQGG